jgi:hypothetical protein
MTMDDDYDDDRKRLRWQRTVTATMIAMATMLQSGSCLRALRRWFAKEKRELFFLLLRVFFIIILFFFFFFFFF